MAILGLFFGLVGGITSTAIWWGVHTMQQAATRTRCASNLSMIGSAALMYSNADPRGSFPPDFSTLATSQGLPATVFVSPDTATIQTLANNPAVNVDQLDYVWIGKSQTNRATAIIVLAYEPPSNHGGRGAHFLFADGSVRFVSNAQEVIDDLKAGNNPPKVMMK